MRRNGSGLCQRTTTCIGKGRSFVELPSEDGMARRSNVCSPRSASLVAQKKLLSSSQLRRGSRVAVYVEMAIPLIESGNWRM